MCYYTEFVALLNFPVSEDWERGPDSWKNCRSKVLVTHSLKMSSWTTCGRFKPLVKQHVLSRIIEKPIKNT